ncbi:MAG: 16S rRNA (cytosine(1402)-N(4))-methyltransferase RsmH [Pseudomonadales bacterium]
MSGAHKPIMPVEVLDGWYTGSAGNYIDGTFGRGGHSELLLKKLDGEGALLAIDRDPEAIAAAGNLRSAYRNFECEQMAFADLADAIEKRGWRGRVSGILLDLGVSSPQLDEARRGFSFMRDGPLDMRMDPGHGLSAAQWLAAASAAEITSVLLRFGEERHARRIARAIVDRREEQPLLTTTDLVALVDDAIPARERQKNKHAATKTFQAIRIFINAELEQLELFLEACLDWLQPGGRLAVISFHSLEDRLVKRFMRNKSVGNKIPAYVPVRDDQLNREMRILVRACRASDAEIADNPRARSAVLRVAEKI